MALSFAAQLSDWLFGLSFLAITLIGIGILSTPALYFAQQINGSRARRDSAAAITAASDAALPPVLVQLPVYNEPEVVEDLLRSVAALDWPKDRLHIQLLNDSTDQTNDVAAKTILQLCAEGYRADHIERSGRIGFKAGALAEGLSLSDEPYIAVLDADFRPPSNWLKLVLPLLLKDPAAGFVQSRCEFVNAGSSWLTRTQSLLFDAHFVMEQAPRARAGLIFQFNGTGGVWRRKAIESAGGWLDDTLSEDLDLTIRAALAGWHGAFAMQPPVTGLMPDTLAAWGKQQRRWSMGFAQTATKLAGPVWRSGWPFAKKVSAEFLIFYQSFLPLMLAFLIALCADAVFGGAMRVWILAILVFVAVFTVAVAVSMTLPPYLALRRGSFGNYSVALAALPVMILYLVFRNGVAVVGAALGRKESFARTRKWQHGKDTETVPLRSP